jgi:polyhydroxybutyrate depolymerase
MISKTPGGDVRTVGFTLLAVAIAAGLLVGASSAQPQQQQGSVVKLPRPSLEADQANPKLMAGLEIRKISLAGRDRVYFVHKPGGLGSAAPLLFVLHGGNGTAPRRALQTGFNDIADRDRFIVVYPQGEDYGWNDGRANDASPGHADGEATVDDVAFFRSMIDDFINRREADPKRVYVIGGSNGGMMTQRLACDATDKIAAAAAIVASIPVAIASSCRPSRPIPILMMNGTADPLMPFEGGQVAGNRGSVIPVIEAVDFWRRINGCSDTPESSEMPDRDPADGIRTDVRAWQRCSEGSEVVFFRMNGAGHGLPGRSQNKAAVAEQLGGKSSNDFDSSEEAWKFVRRFSLR